MTTNIINDAKCGIDWSMSSPGVCITSGFFVYMYGFSNKKKDHGVYTSDNIIFEVISIPKKWKNNSERFDEMANNILSILQKHNISTVNLEGYAMGARGSMAYTIGESTGFLKSKLWLNDITINIIAPTSVKKFATGKGNANKDMMFEAFNSATPNTLPKIDCLEDCIDAYWLSKYNEDFYETITRQCDCNKDITQHNGELTKNE